MKCTWMERNITLLKSLKWNSPTRLTTLYSRDRPARKLTESLLIVPPPCTSDPANSGSARLGEEKGSGVFSLLRCSPVREKDSRPLFLFAALDGFPPTWLGSVVEGTLQALVMHHRQEKH